LRDQEFDQSHLEIPEDQRLAVVWMKMMKAFESGFVKPTVVAAAQWPPLLPFNFTYPAILISLKTFQFKVE
jgi:hypothetical protein